MRRRIIILIILIGAVAYVPWWLSVIIAVGAMWRFGSRYELLWPTAIADLAHGSPLPQLFNFAFSATLLTALAIALGRSVAHRFFLQA